MRRLLAQIVAVEGARGLWIGTPANMLRSMVTSASQLGVNSRLKEAAKGSSLVPGIFSDACCASSPDMCSSTARFPAAELSCFRNSSSELTLSSMRVGNLGIGTARGQKEQSETTVRARADS